MGDPHNPTASHLVTPAYYREDVALRTENGAEWRIQPQNRGLSSVQLEFVLTGKTEVKRLSQC